MQIIELNLIEETEKEYIFQLIFEKKIFFKKVTYEYDCARPKQSFFGSPKSYRLSDGKQLNMLPFISYEIDDAINAILNTKQKKYPI